MARGATTRSQRPPKASQSQTQPSTSQRSQRLSRHDEDEDEDEEQPENDDDGEEEVIRSVESDHTRKTNDLVRLALFMEQKRIPLRREDIVKKVLGSGQTRAFNRVFESAQPILRKTFGMELVELKSRSVVEQLADGMNKKGGNSNADDDLEEARNATGVRKKSAAAGSKTYILRSILNPAILEYAALSDVDILEEEAVDAPDDDDDDGNSHHYGSIISWSSADQLGSAGILYVILALILVSGKVMSDMDLRANLKRLRLPATGEVALNAEATARSLPIDTYLKLLMRQGFLEQQLVGQSKSASGGKKRSRTVAAPSNQPEDGGIYEWRWGTRAHSEVGEKGIAKFVAEFMAERMGEGDGNDNVEEESAAARKKRRDAATKRLGAIMTGVQRAAGGSLMGIQ